MYVPGNRIIIIQIIQASNQNPSGQAHPLFCSLIGPIRDTSGHCHDSVIVKICVSLVMFTSAVTQLDFNRSVDSV